MNYYNFLNRLPPKQTAMAVLRINQIVEEKDVQESLKYFVESFKNEDSNLRRIYNLLHKDIIDGVHT